MKFSYETITTNLGARILAKINGRCEIILSSGTTIEFSNIGFFSKTGSITIKESITLQDEVEKRKIMKLLL